MNKASNQHLEHQCKCLKSDNDRLRKVLVNIHNLATRGAKLELIATAAKNAVKKSI